MIVKSDPLHALQTDLRILLQHLQTRKSNLRFEQANRDTILESINDGVLVLDDQDVIKYANGRLEQMIGTTIDRWRDAHISQFYNFLLDRAGDQDLHRLQTVYYSVLGKRNLVADSCELNWGKPSSKYLQVYTGPISHQKQIYLGRVWKFEDVSRQKELDQMKVEMVSLASHQLRTPLTAIRGYLKMIEGGDYGELPENLQKPFSVLMHSTEKMRELINDLLDVSRLDSGKVAVEPQQMDLISVLQEEIAEQAGVISQKQIKLKFNPVLPSITVDNDPKIVREMFKNYLSNAIKYTPQGGEVEVRISFADSRSIQVLVIDQGIGVPAKQQQSLFQKFFRADNAQSSAVEGTGLGLYYVRKCADLVGAALGFKSVEGEGSNFWFNLPLEFNSQIVN